MSLLLRAVIRTTEHSQLRDRSVSHQHNRGDFEPIIGRKATQRTMLRQSIRSPGEQKQQGAEVTHVAGKLSQMSFRVVRMHEVECGEERRSKFNLEQYSFLVPMVFEDQPWTAEPDVERIQASSNLRRDFPWHPHN